MSISTYIHLQALAGNVDECSWALEGYGSACEGKDARYINYCDLWCYTHWINSDYLTAIKWGAEGIALKETSNVDTKFDTAHNLALARRDAGIIDPALQYFLKGRKIGDIIDEKEPDSLFSAADYGNVGRCLHLMGQIDPALSCYRKSAKLISRAPTTQLFENRDYIRQWIGEVLVSKGDFKTGLAFLEAGKVLWEALSPPKANKVERVIHDVVGDQPYEPPAAAVAEEVVVRWLNGR
jgi:tetratricopeptide (TPR) repeat protein